MRRALPLLVLLTSLGVAAPAFAVQDAAVGEWLTPDGSTKVTAAPCPGAPARLCGAITWMRRPEDRRGETWRDLHNPDAGLRQRPLIGVLAFRQMQNAGPGHWANGSIYDPATGRTLKGRVRALPDDRLIVEGCDAAGCKAETWSRAL